MRLVRGLTALALLFAPAGAAAYDVFEACEVTVNQQTGEVIVDAYGLPNGPGTSVTVQIGRVTSPSQYQPGTGYYTAQFTADAIDANHHARARFLLPGAMGLFQVDVTAYDGSSCRISLGRGCALFMLHTNVCNVVECTPNPR